MSPRRSGRRQLTALLGANAISICGTAMTMLAIPWFVLSTTGSAAKTGLAAFCEGAAFAASAALGGLWVDRLGRRMASIVSDVVSGASVAAIAVLHLNHALPFWLLLVLAATANLARAPGETARYVLLPRLADQAEVALERVTSAADGVSRGARMAGAPLAGVLIAVLGAPNVLLVDAATFAASALLVWSAVSDPQGRREDVGHPLDDLRAGLAFLVRDPLIRAITLMVMLTNMLDAALGAVLLPVYAREVLGSPVALGLLMGAFGVGALSGAITYGAIGPRLPRRLVYALAFIVVGAPRFGILAIEPHLIVVIVTMVLAGFAAGAINPILTAVEFERVPLHMQGRVLGTVTAGAYVAIPFGALAAGWLVTSVGLRWSLVAIGAIYLLVTLSPLVGRAWRTMDDNRGVVQRERPLITAQARPTPGTIE
jgi:MFS family permease